MCQIGDVDQAGEGQRPEPRGGHRRDPAIPGRATVVSPATSSELRRTLAALAGNFAFSWQPETRSLFAALDPAGWARLGEAPRALLDELEPEALGRLAAGGELLAQAGRARRALEEELAAPSWWEATHPAESGLLVAYFSSEFGVDASLPVYSGGLGVLAGDHLKASSELGLDLVGVGLLYGHGYFRQRLDDYGRQVAEYPRLDPARCPLTLERGAAGEPVDVRVELAGEDVAARVWRADVGRSRLYLLDSDLEENSPAGRGVTATLYGGDREQRIRQELLLGVGGVRMLAALGLRPTVFHMNEGHAAFLALERAGALVAETGARPGEALAFVRATTLFTTHTPVPAGNDVFDHELVWRYVAALAAAAGISWEELLALGCADEAGGPFGMTPLALRTTAAANGVSRVHGEVARAMWAPLWPGVPAAEVPIGHVTNGVHARTWLAASLAALLHEAGVRPGADPGEQAWERAAGVPDEVLWESHLSAKRTLAARVPGLDPEALTIGFARRFATYKRAGLLFSQPERLARLAGDPARPVQVLLAGKAHPADEAGKDVMQAVVGYARAASPRIAFLEDYDMAIARELVQGCDVWLNTPRRPLEASGTSGMKAALNGVLNLSVLDGWWAEAYSPEIGWAIGGEEERGDDTQAAESLYHLLEEAVVPLYYGDRPGWVRMMKASIAQVGAAFDAKRMVCEYAERYYAPAHRSARAASSGATGLT